MLEPLTLLALTAAAACCVGIAVVRHLYVSYGLYIAFVGCIDFVLAVANARIASNMQTRRFALPLAINTFLSLLAQTVVQAIIANAVDMNLFHRFFVYSGFVFCALIVAVYWWWTDILRTPRNKTEPEVHSPAEFLAGAIVEQLPQRDAAATT